MKVEVLGVDIDAVTMDEAVAIVETLIKKSQHSLVATANAEMVMMAQKDTVLANVLASADLVVPDGAGVVWAARHKGQKVPERVAGYDLVQKLLIEAAQKGYKVYFFGGAPGVAELAKTVAERRYPGLEVVGISDGFFNSQQEEAIICKIHAVRPDILLVALGVPKQEKWLAAHLDELQVPISMGVGGTFDVMAGNSRRAPLWMQQASLEWMYRLFCQPSRIIRMLALPHFVVKVLLTQKTLDKNKLSVL